MSNLRRVINSAFNSSQVSHVADALISDALTKYGASEASRKNLSPQQKQKIKQIVAELQSKVNKTIK